MFLRHYIRLLTVLLMNSIIATATVQAKPNLWQSADSLYASGQYVEAARTYEGALKKGESFALYYNLGNAYYRQKQYGRAMCAYQRALRLNPSDADVRDNINILNANLNHSNVPASRFFLYDWFMEVRDLFTQTTWAWIGGIMWLLCCLFFFLFYIAQAKRPRKLWFAASVLAFVLMACCWWLAYSQWHYYNRKERGVVLETKVELYSSPDAKAKHLKDLYEGMVVEVNATTKEWIHVVMPDQSEGWILARQLEII
ncbi:MAG: tetratricopeptide repeat protein [Alloprevotella sp.]|nr:tetratricopeptide repeat protein [Alloprevotella sp.]